MQISWFNWARSGAALMLCMLATRALAGTPLAVMTPAPAVRDAGITIQTAASHLEDEVFQVDVELDYRFSAEVLEALENGVPITIALEFEIFQPRNWLWDREIAKLNQRYRLEFHALTRQYLVTNVNSQSRESYPSLRLALLAMGAVRRLPLLDKRLLKVGQTYYAQVRARLLIEELPAPMRPWAYLSRSWRLSSDWYTWQLQ